MLCTALHTVDKPPRACAFVLPRHAAKPSDIPSGARHVMRWIEVLIIRFLLRDYTLNDEVRMIHSMAPCIKYDRAV